MGNTLNCFSDWTNEQDLYDEQAPLSKSKAALTIQNTFRRGKASLEFKRLIVCVIRERFQKINPKTRIFELTQSSFNEKINSLTYATPILEQYSKNLANITYEGSELNYELMPLEFVDSEKNQSEYYYGTWSAKGDTCGVGTLISSNGNIYKGTFSSGVFNGTGVFINSQGDYYFGEWLNGECNGKGIIYIKDKLKYEGPFIKNMKNGEGIEEYSDGSEYKGTFRNNEKEGKGKYTFKDGSYYIGNFHCSQYNGEGEYHWSDGRLYKGSFKDGNMDGKKAYHRWSDGSFYQGDYVNNKKQGFGAYYWPNGKKFVGNWINNEPHGNGYYLLDGQKYSITFRFGKIISSKNTE